MPPTRPQSDPPTPGTPPPAQPPDNLSARVDGLEAEQKRQGGMLEQILSRLPGKGPAPSGGPAPAADPPPSGKSVAEQVREGIEALEAERSAAAEADAGKKAREDHAARLAALEERVPAETAATPVGALRATLQRGIFGIDRTGK